MNGDINQTIQGIISLKNSGRNPQAIMQMIMQQNPQYQQMLTMLQNMAQGKNPKEFIMQLARQGGVSPQNMQAISQMFDN